MFKAEEINRLQRHADSVMALHREAAEFFDEPRTLPRAEPSPALSVWVGEVKWNAGSDGGTTAATNDYDIYPLGESSQPDAFTVVARRIAAALSPQPIFRGTAGRILKAPLGSLCLYTRNGAGAVVLLCVFGETPQRRVC